MDDERFARARSDPRELLQARKRVQRVPAEKVRGLVDRSALPTVLVTPIGRDLWHTGEVEVEVRRPSRGTRGARQDHAQNVRMLVLVDDRAKREQLACRLRRVPPANETGRLCNGLFQLGNSAVNFPKLVFEHERVVRPSLYVHQQAIERGDVDARRVEAALECLHECRPGTREWIEDVLTGPKVSPEQHLDELRDELAEIGVEPVDVLCPLAFGQLALRPRELEIDVRIEGVLGRCHPATIRRVAADSSERVGNPLEPTLLDGDDVEGHPQAGQLRMRLEPCRRRPS